MEKQNFQFKLKTEKDKSNVRLHSCSSHHALFYSNRAAQSPSSRQSQAQMATRKTRSSSPQSCLMAITTVSSLSLKVTVCTLETTSSRSRCVISFFARKLIINIHFSLQDIKEGLSATISAFASLEPLTFSYAFF